MLHDGVKAHPSHLKFIEQVAKTGLVYGLMSPEGYATSSSDDYEDVSVIPFWSDNEAAAACAVEDWKDYLVVELPLAEFLETWCVGMHNDNLLTGTNWNENLQGTEIEPLQLAIEVLEELKKIGTTLPFTKYPSQENFEILVKQVWKSEE